ncbi:GDP-L-fucose synthase [Litorivicinus lipolyticus]|uniref:GDP-L-fucose synthase n=1 Tax=Litorivicinus lipolyticus TaxID=418701 RepID=UPI003B594294
MTKKIYVAGHNGMVGSALIRRLGHEPTNEIITATRTELDLTNQQAVFEFFADKKIDQIYLAAAKVGGIQANNVYPADFIYENLMIEANIIHSAHMNNVNKLLFLGSSCIYPKMANQPIKEDALLSGYLEPTNEPYAIAKIAGIKLCESYNRQYGRDYRSVMPCNLYGPGDNFHPENSHVIPALIRKFDEAKINGHSEVEVWGTGAPRREFLHVDDMADASIHVMNLKEEIYRMETCQTLSHLNIGAGYDLSIREISEKIAMVVGYKGLLRWDETKPDGTPKKLMLSNKISALGWTPNISLEAGLKSTYDWYRACDKGLVRL